jgi:hypothetical protein
MLIDTPQKIIGYTGVEFSVLTFNNIDTPRHSKINVNEIYSAFDFDGVSSSFAVPHSLAQQTLPEEARGVLIQEALT